MCVCVCVRRLRQSATRHIDPLFSSLTFPPRPWGSKGRAASSTWLLFHISVKGEMFLLVRFSKLILFNQMVKCTLIKSSSSTTFGKRRECFWLPGMMFVFSKLPSIIAPVPGGDETLQTCLSFWIHSFQFDTTLS